MNRLNESGRFRFVSKREAQAPDRGVQAVLEIHEGALGPQAPAQIFPGHDVTRPFEQGGEDLQRLLLQGQADAPLAQLTPAEVHLEGAKSDDLSERICLHHSQN